MEKPPVIRRYALVAFAVAMMLPCQADGKTILMIPREGSENLEIAPGHESGVMLDLLKAGTQ